MFSPSKGAGFTGTGADIKRPITSEMVDASRIGAQNNLQAQQDFLNQLAAQNGIQNQSQAYNMLLQQAQGNGPNPALAQLANATGQNTANQAALMAGQRGAGANVGLLARQAAMQGSANQQNAAGQAAVLQAQQQLAGQNALAGLATQQVGQQAGALGNLNQFGQNQENMLLNSMAQQNNAVLGNQSNLNNVNAGIAQGNQAFQQGVLKNVTGGAGSLLELAHGGYVPMADGGQVNPPPPSPQMLAAQDSMRKAFKFAEGGPVSSFGQMLMNQSNSLSSSNPDISSGGMSRDTSANMQAGQGVGDSFAKAMNHKRSMIGSQVGQLGSSDLMSAAPAGMMMAAYGGAMDYTNGGKLPGKAEVKGDSLKNDKVPILGSPGEIMIPRSIAQSKDAPQKAAEFVAAILAKQKRKK